MTAVRESFIYSIFAGLWHFLLGLYEHSAFKPFWDRLAAGWTRIWRESAVGGAFMSDGRLSIAWGDSLFARILDTLVNLPGRLLRLLYSASPEFWQGCGTLRAVSWCGRNGAVLYSWLLLAVLCVPQEYWNNVYSALGVGLIAVLVMASAMSPEGVRFDVKGAGFFAVLFLGFAALATVTSVSGRESLRFFIFHATCALAVLIIVSTCAKAEGLDRLCLFTALGVLVSSGYGFLQKLRGIEINYTWVDMSVSGDTPGRVTSFFDNPNAFGVLLVLCLPLCLALVINGKGFRRLVGLAAFLAGTLALLLTYSRGAWAGYVLAVAVTVLLLRPKLLPVFFVIGCAALAALPESIFNRILSSFVGDSSMGYRQRIYNAALALISREPLGVGLGSDVVAGTVNRLHLFDSPAKFVHSHSVYFQITAEMGVFALAAFLLSMYSRLREGVKAVWRSPKLSSQRVTAACAAGGLAGALLFSLADYPWFYPRIMLIFWTVFAILCAAVRLGKKEAQ